MLYTLHFFSSKCNLFHNANLFGSCIIHILYTECAKIKKNNSGAKGLIFSAIRRTPTLKLQYLILLRILLQKNQRKKLQQDCTRLATTCQCICCIITKLNLTHCDTPHAMLSTKGFIKASSR